MSGHAYELRGAGGLEGLSLEDALRRWKSGDGAFWIDTGTVSDGVLERVLGELGVSEFLVTRCLRVGKSTVALALPNATFASFPLFADVARTRRTYGGVLCLANLLVTFRSEPVENAERMHQKIEQLELDDGGTASLLCTLLATRAGATAAVARELRDELSVLGERMDADPAAVDAAVLERLKRRIALLDAIAEEQQAAFQLISHASSPGFSPSAVAPQLGLLNTMAATTERLVNRNDARIDNLLRRSQDLKTDRLNRRLGLLTIISAIFLPLSLLAGIWGMNFEHMPELDHPYAYAGALAMMAAVAVGSLLFLRWRGWFD